MRKPRIYVLLLGIAVLFITARAFFLSGRGPSYNGRSLSSWIEAEGNVVHVEGSDPFRDAIRHIGTNAVPYLVKWIQYQPPAWKTKVYGTVNPVLRSLNRDWKFTDTQQFRAGRVPHAFEILGPDAAPAIPELTRLLRDPKNAKTSRGIAMALGSISKDALPSLLVAVTDDHPHLRAAGIVGISFLGTNASPAVPLLLGSLKDADVTVACAAAKCLGRLKIAPGPVVCALGNALLDSRPLVRQNAAGALWGFGEDARPAIPMLVGCLRDPDAFVARIAAVALGKLNLESSLAVPALIECLQDSRTGVPDAAASSLGQFGAEAQPATPALLNLLTNSEPSVRMAATSALQKIDPRAMVRAIR